MTEQLQAAWTKSRHSLPKNRFYHQDLVSANKNRKRKYTAIFDRSIKSLINFIYIPNGTSCSENSTQSSQAMAPVYTSLSLNCHITSRGKGGGWKLVTRGWGVGWGLTEFVCAPGSFYFIVEKSTCNPHHIQFV